MLIKIVSNLVHLSYEWKMIFLTSFSTCLIAGNFIIGLVNLSRSRTDKRRKR